MNGQSYEGMTKSDLVGTIARECDELRVEIRNRRERQEIRISVIAFRGDNRWTVTEHYHYSEWEDVEPWAERKMLAELLRVLRERPATGDQPV